MSKKLLFSAVALIAFSSVSMGNTTLENRQVIVENVNKELNKTTSCEDNAINIYNYVMDTFNDGGDDILLLNVLLGQCKD